MSSVDVISGSQLDITWGCFFLALPITSVLWGIGCLQLYLYYEKYWETDQRWFKLYILIVWILDTVHQVFVVVFEYVYFVKAIIDPESRTILRETLFYIIPFTAIIDSMIQIILVRRVWYLSDRNRVISGILSTAVLAQFATTMARFFKVYNFTEITQIYTALYLELAFTCVAVFTETSIAAVLVWLLWKARSGLPSSYSLVNRLVTYIMGSSSVTVLCMVTAMISAIVAPHSFIYMMVDIVIPKLYFNCMLTSLNVRSRLRENLAAREGDVSLHFTDPCASSEGQSNTTSSHVSSKAPALVSAERRTDIDAEAASCEPTASTARERLAIASLSRTTENQ